MKICFLCHNICSYGGTERIVSSVSRKFKNLGFDCYALSMGKKEKLFFDFSAFLMIDYLYRTGNRIAVMHDRVKKIRNFLIENDIDVLITVGGHLNYYGWRSKGKCRWIAWDHEMFDFNKSFYVKFSKYIGVKKADKIVALTDYDKNRYAETYRNSENKVVVIGNFTENYHVKEKKGNNIVVTAGRLWNIKQFDLLIEAWAIICKEVSDWKLIILGEGTERNKLESLVKKYNMENVLLPGNKKNINEYYEAADIFTITSTAEGFSLVLLEAMAHSLPIVGFRSNGGVEELVDDNNGILVRQGDVSSLAEALRVMIKNPQKQEMMGNASYKKSLKFAPQTIIDKWIKLLKNIE